jgi:hypothetical protein
VVVTEGWELARHSGDFEMRRDVAKVRFGIEDYQSFISRQRVTDNRKAVQTLAQANDWLRAGEQEKAAAAFSKAANGRGLDEASNEDARVQLEKLRTEQAVVGLNTRRQKLYFDNQYRGGGGQRNEQLEQAASANPVYNNGTLNWDPQQVDQLLLGNTADENAALKSMANRIVGQQLAVEPAPAGLEVTLPERGTVVTFGRSVQVDGGKPLVLDLGLRPVHRGGVAAGLLLASLIAFGLWFGRRARARTGAA